MMRRASPKKPPATQTYSTRRLAPRSPPRPPRHGLSCVARCASAPHKFRAHAVLTARRTNTRPAGWRQHACCRAAPWCRNAECCLTSFTSARSPSWPRCSCCLDAHPGHGSDDRRPVQHFLLRGRLLVVQCGHRRRVGAFLT